MIVTTNVQPTLGFKDITFKKVQGSSAVKVYNENNQEVGDATVDSNNGDISYTVHKSNDVDGMNFVYVEIDKDTFIGENANATSITTNGTHTITPTDSTLWGLTQAEVNVNVPNGTETLTATENGTYTPTAPNIGFSSVNVDVPLWDQGYWYITQNGTRTLNYDVAHYKGVSAGTIEVNVPSEVKKFRYISPSNSIISGAIDLTTNKWTIYDGTSQSFSAKDAIFLINIRTEYIQITLYYVNTTATLSFPDGSYYILKKNYNSISGTYLFDNEGNILFKGQMWTSPVNSNVKIHNSYFYNNLLIPINQPLTN